MVRFSERYGYVKPNEIIVRECITEPIRNSICNWFATLRNKDRNKYISLEKIVWIHFLDKKLDNFPYHDFYEVTDIICNFIDSSKNEWYYKLDLIEFVCPYIMNVFGEVIFGYGDESDDEYKKLQKINDNEYLRHIKTNRYLETPNYRDLLAFIDSAPFQVCIMGHSCGLSDKTLLNTLFEHRNCVSIKPYYYVNEQGKDNYLDIVQNISRNFTNPQLMRDRVVNKTYCSPLPQKDTK